MCKYGVGPKFDYGDPKAEPKILCTNSKLVTVELDWRQAYSIGPMLIGRAYSLSSNVLLICTGKKREGKKQSQNLTLIVTCDV